MSNSKSYVIRSNLGIIVPIVIASCGLMTWGAINLLLGNPPYETSTFFEKVVAILVIPAITLTSLTMLTERYSVSKDGIYKSNLWVKRELKWEQIARISVVAGYGYIPFCGYNIIIHPKSIKDKPISVTAALYGNSRKVVKGIIEASYKSKSHVSIGGSLLDNYGMPPYGIFKED